MRLIVVGYGIQGKKRAKFAGVECVGIVDPISKEAQFQKLELVPLESFDAAMVCTPDEPKLSLIEYLLKNKKHVLVEKPLFSDSRSSLEKLHRLSNENKAVLYTAYNHRFEPHFVNLKNFLASNKLGELYLMKVFYGNGTARDYRDSNWRDQGTGVLHDIGSHLVDIVSFFFDKNPETFSALHLSNFENKSFDYVSFYSPKNSSLPRIEMEATLLSWRNTFRLDLFAEHGSVHIDGLCKWGPSVFTHRVRILPSGRPPEDSQTLIQPDPTWEIEYLHFKNLVERSQESTKGSQTRNSDLEYLSSIPQDIWIQEKLDEIDSSLSRRKSGPKEFKTTSSQEKDLS